MRKYIRLQNLQILYTLVLRAEIATIFVPNVVAISKRNTKVYKICELCKAIFSTFYNISQPNFAISLTLVCSFREYTFCAKIKKLVYNGKLGIVYCEHGPQFTLPIFLYPISFTFHPLRRTECGPCSTLSLFYLAGYDMLDQCCH